MFISKKNISKKTSIFLILIFITLNGCATTWWNSYLIHKNRPFTSQYSEYKIELNLQTGIYDKRMDLYGVYLRSHYIHKIYDENNIDSIPVLDIDSLCIYLTSSDSSIYPRLDPTYYAYRNNPNYTHLKDPYRPSIVGKKLYGPGYNYENIVINKVDSTIVVRYRAILYDRKTLKEIERKWFEQTLNVFLIKKFYIFG